MDQATASQILRTIREERTKALSAIADSADPNRQTHKTCPEHWRAHNHVGLEVGKNQVKQMERHYAKHGIHVDHRPTADGKGFQPVVTSVHQYERMLKARGMTNRWGE